MNPLKVTSWEKKAFRAALFGSIFVLVVFLIVGGINWLIFGARLSKDLPWITLSAFCAFYFTEAINSIHERLSEIADAVRHNHG